MNQNGKSGTSFSWNSAWILEHRTTRLIHHVLTESLEIKISEIHSILILLKDNYSPHSLNPYPTLQSDPYCVFISPKHDVVIKVTRGSYTGHNSLWSKAGFHKGPRVEHTQKRVDQHLPRQTKQNYTTQSKHDHMVSFYCYQKLLLYSYIFSPWCGRMVTVVRKVASEDVEFAGNDPPGVAQGGFTAGWQKDLELAGIICGRRNSRALP